MNGNAYRLNGFILTRFLRFIVCKMGESISANKKGGGFVISLWKFYLVPIVLCEWPVGDDPVKQYSFNSVH